MVEIQYLNAPFSLNIHPLRYTVMTSKYETEKLIVPCEHRGVSFYAFVDVILEEQIYQIHKTIPDIGVDLPMKILFSDLSKPENFDRKMSDTLCDSINQHLAAHLL